MGSGVLVMQLNVILEQLLGQLTVPQAATLAGMLTSPNAYNPADHPGGF